VSVTITAPFTDANLADTHTATVDWGDGTNEAMTVEEEGGSGTASASHTYAARGRYTVTVRVTDPGDLAASGTVVIKVSTAPVKNVAPVAVPGGPYSGVEDVPLTLDGSGSYDPDGNTPLTYAWDSNYNGRTFVMTHTGATPSVTYSAAGTYTVALQVTDSLGLVSKVATTTVTVIAVDTDAAPIVGPVTVTPGTRVTAGTPVTVSVTFSDANAGDVHNATVDWGDGSSDAMLITEGAGFGTASASHTYELKGRYTVTVTVSDGDLAGSATAIVQVQQPPKPPKETTTLETQAMPEPTTVPEPTVLPDPTPEPTPDPTPPADGEEGTGD
jgi:PKD repeat protein